MMSDDYILRSEWDGVLEMRFNRPEKLNALSLSMFGAIRQAVDDLRERDDLRVMLIRSKGRYFSAGADLTESQKQDLQGSPTKAREWMRTKMGNAMHSLYEEMERVEKPIVIAHQAMCVGGGLEMSLSCDFRLAAQSAGYWFPEMQLGMLPLSNGVAKLTRICGGHWARWMVVANERVTAEEARIMGLVHKVYPDDTFEADVEAFCKKLAGFPREVVAAGKLAVEMCQDLPIDQARQLERLTYSSLAFSPESAAMSAKVRERLKGG
jgi:enoyl-CoA hydratase/carnithine racemase